MKRLIIHTDDRSTDFLRPIYKNLDDVTLISAPMNKYVLQAMIDRHDQVMMLGHGCAWGLFGNSGFVIDDSFADQLRERDNSVFIWCNADQYVTHNNLKGFYTGMFVSEPLEARFVGIGYAQQSDVNESNTRFVNSLSRVSDCNPEMMHSYVKHAYGDLIHHNVVAKYNHERLYVQ